MDGLDVGVGRDQTKLLAEPRASRHYLMFTFKPRSLTFRGQNEAGLNDATHTQPQRPMSDSCRARGTSTNELPGTLFLSDNE